VPSPHQDTPRRSEFAALTLTIVALWAKQLYAGLAVQTFWPGQSLATWALEHTAMFASTYGGALLLTAWTVLLPRGVQAPALLVINVLATTLIVADYIYIYFTGDVLSVLDTISSPAMARAVTASVVEWIEPGLAWFYADVALGVLLLVFTRARAASAPVRTARWRKRASLGLSALGTGLVAPAFVAVTLSEDGIFAFDALQRDVWSTIGSVPYHAADVVVHSRGETRRNSAPFVKSYFDRRAATPAPAAPLFGAGKGANLILISGESLQAFPLSLTINGVRVAPRLAEFASSSLSFTRFYDQTHLGTTSDAELLALNSLHPLPVGFAVFRDASNTFAALPSLLRKAGYTTVSAVGASGDFWNMRRMHRQYGFNTSFYEDSYEVDQRIGGWLADRSFYAQTVPRLQALKEPFFAFLLTSSNHHPFKGAGTSSRFDVGALQGTLLGDYLQSVHEFDTAFGAFIDELRAAGLLDRSVVALYGDHQGFVGEEAGLPTLLEIDARDELERFLVRKRVPFLVRLPGGQHAGPQDVPGGHLDIAPTLASLMGVAAGPMMIGRDVTAVRGRPIVFRDGSFLYGGAAYINAFGALSSARCYALDSRKLVDCQLLNDARAAAREQLRVSDAILGADLIRPQ
jgi:phosphoglycerol transferase MdoB-like AlkP superfamily enzyme